MQPTRWHAAGIYVTGAHNVKIGYQGVHHWDYRAPYHNDQRLDTASATAYRTSSTQRLADHRTDSRTRYDAIYVQDQWTRGKATLQGALRYDYARSYYPAQQIGPTPVPPDAACVPGYEGRSGVPTTSIRGSASHTTCLVTGKRPSSSTRAVLEPAVNGNGNYSELLPASRVPTNVTRTWNDAEPKLRGGL